MALSTFFKSIGSKIANGIDRVDQFGDEHKKVLILVFTLLVTGAAFFLTYELFTYPDLSYKVQWNMFESPVLNFMLPIAIIVSVVRGIMGKLDLSGPEHEYVEVTWSDGSKETYENNSMIDYIFRTILWPLLSYLVIVPLFYCALVYYPIVGLLALIGMALPYVLSALAFLFALLTGIFTLIVKRRGRGLMYWFFTLLTAAGILCGAILLEQRKQMKHPALYSYNTTVLVQD